MALFELALLVLVFLMGLSIVWSTLKTGISPMMSSSKACQAMIASIDGAVDIDGSTDTDGSANGPLIDLGSGWGTLVIAVAQKYPHQHVIGYELSWFPWLVSIIRKHSLGLDNLTLHNKDFRTADLSSASILFCYLFSEAMQALQEKLSEECLNDILIVSNNFALPSCKATTVSRINDIYQSPIYVYHWQPKNSFTPKIVENNTF